MCRVSPIPGVLLSILASTASAGEIHDLLEKGEVEKAKRLLASNPGLVHSRDGSSRTPLHVAARYGHVHVARWLLEHGAEVNAQAYNNSTALHVATDPDMVKLLLEHDADIEAVTSYGDTALQKAARHGTHPKAPHGQAVAKLLIAAGACYDIRSAIFLNDSDRVRELLKKDAKLANARDQDYTPLHWAAQEGHAPIVKLLLENKADVHAKGFRQETPLVKAIRHPAVVKLLLDAGADANIPVNVMGAPPDYTLLDMAAHGGHVESAKLLLAHGVDTKLRTDSGFTALHSAAFAGHEQMVRLLLKEGLDANARTTTGWTPMSSAASKIRSESDDTRADNARYTRVIKVLRAHGVPLGLFGSIALGDIDRLRTLLEADPALANQKEPGSPVLHYAAKLGRKDVVSLLLDRGADVNTTDDHGSTALHVAAFWGRAKIAETLLRHKADVNACTRTGMTPLHESARLGTPGVAKLLLGAGAKVDVKDRKGRTPLDCAKDSIGRSYSKPGHAEVVKLLRAHGGEG